MAGSRLERIGTIYSRATGLLKSGALNWEDRPLWYDIYEAFPPKEEPRYDRPIPNLPIKKIFYQEDKIRAIFHRNNKQIGTVNLTNPHFKSLTQRFIENYQKLEQQYEGKATEEQLYMETIDLLKRERDSKREFAVSGENEPISLSTAFKEAQSKSTEKTLKIDIKEILKD